MNPRHLSARNYRSFAELDLDLPDGCVAIVGDNGAGKSSIVNIIDLALFGPESRSWAPYLTDDVDDQQLQIELTFDHGADTYRVRRTYSPRGNGKTTLDLERYARVDARWEPLTLGNARDTQQQLEEVLGMTRRTLRASALLLQGDGGAFTAADPRDRKAVLAEILGLDRFDQLLEAARVDRRATENELERLTGAVEHVTEQLNGRDTVTAELAAAENAVARAVEAIERAEQRERELAQRLVEFQTAAAERAVVNADLQTATVVLHELDKRAQAAIDARAELARVEEQIKTLPTAAMLEQFEREEHQLRDQVEKHTAAMRAHEIAKLRIDAAVADHQRLVDEAAALHKQALAAAARADELEQAGPGSEHCPTCKQTLGVEALAEAVVAFRLEAAGHDAAAASRANEAKTFTFPDASPKPDGVAPVVELAAASETLRDARAKAVDAGRLAERMRTLGETIANGTGPAFTDERAAAAETVKALVEKQSALPPWNEDDYGNVHRDHEQVVGALPALRREHQDASDARARAQAELERLAELERTNAAAVTARAELADQRDVLTLLERAYGRDGIPSLIVENAAIPQIELEANRILEQLGGTTAGCQVELRTERARKSGDGTRDVLDVIVVGPAGERPLETFSGGETSRIQAALRIALARLMATRRGTSCRVLCLDEIEYLDEPGMQALVTVLRNLDEFEKVLLVSHVPSLRDAFDVTIEVVKDGGRSAIAGAAEAVTV